MAELSGELEVDDVGELMDSKVAITMNIRLFENGYVDFDIFSDNPDGVSPISALGALDLVKYSLQTSAVTLLGRIAKAIGEKREKIRAQSTQGSITTDELTPPQGDTKTA